MTKIVVTDETNQTALLTGLVGKVQVLYFDTDDVASVQIAEFGPDDLGAEEFDPEDLVVPTGAPSAMMSEKRSDQSSQAGPSDRQTVSLVEVPGDPLFPVRDIQQGGAARRLLVNLLMRRSGKTRQQVSQAIDQAEGDSGRPFLDWLTHGGLQQLIQLVLSILAVL